MTNNQKPYHTLRMIDVKTAVAKSVEYFTSLMDEKAYDFLLEEVELSEDEKWWRVTLSADVPIPPPPPGLRQELLGISDLAKVFGKEERRRRYKVFTIDAETGKFKSMKMREGQ